MQAGVIDVVSHSEAQTRRFGARLGELLGPGDVLLVEGGLGAGKTVFAQGVAAGLGVVEPVTSPTFTLIHEHAGRLPLYHVDLYRLAGDVEAGGIGLEDYIWGEGVTLVEWPDRAAGLFPEDRLAIHLRPISDTKRSIRFVPRGERYVRLVAEFKRRAFGV